MVGRYHVTRYVTDVLQEVRRDLQKHYPHKHGKS
ncbi:hypothetical protein [Virgibacillus saliphilus]